MYPSQNLSQVQVDMPRTFAEESFFNLKTSLGKETIAMIERICLSYSVRNTVVGYC